MYNNLCTALDTCIWQYVSPVLYDNCIPGHHDQTLQQTNSEKKPLPGQGDIVNTNQNVTVNFCIQSTSNKQIYLLRPKSNEHAYNKSPKGLYSYNCSLMPWQREIPCTGHPHEPKQRADLYVWLPLWRTGAVHVFTWTAISMNGHHIILHFLCRGNVWLGLPGQNQLFTETTPLKQLLASLYCKLNLHITTLTLQDSVAQCRCAECYWSLT